MWIKFFQEHQILVLYSCRSMTGTLVWCMYNYVYYVKCWIVFFFQGDLNTKQKKKIVQKPPYNRAGCIVEPCNVSRQPKFQFCQKVGKGRHGYVRAWPRPSRSAWAETLQTHGFPIQTYGKTSKGRNRFKGVNQNSSWGRTWIKIPPGQILNFDPFCVPIKNYGIIHFINP